VALVESLGGGVRRLVVARETVGGATR